MRNIDWNNVTITFQILNFRREVIYKVPATEEDQPIAGAESIEIAIDDTIANLLRYGSYQFLFTLSGSNQYAPLYLQNIFDISVVEKRISNNKESLTNGEEEDDYDIHLILDGGEEGSYGALDFGN